MRYSMMKFEKEVKSAVPLQEGFTVSGVVLLV
jgi:hypothetical protein